MKTLHILFFYINFNFIHSKNLQTTTLKTEIKQYPFLAAIVQEEGSGVAEDCLCAGTIVNTLWILSAGHCTVDEEGEKDPDGTLAAILGSPLCYTPSGRAFQKLLITKSIVHPQYNFKDSAYTFNDLVLFGVEEPIVFTTTVQPAPLASPKTLSGKQPEALYKKCVVAGWGAREVDTFLLTNEVYSIPLPIVPIKECRPRIKYDVESSICTRSQAGLDICDGDAGGPLICGGVQVGVISATGNCGEVGEPSVFSRVDRYWEWIKNIVAPDECNYSCSLKTTGHVFLFAYLVVELL